MTRLRLRTNQKLRLQELLKVIRLPQLHANTIQAVRLKSAFTGATEQFDVACIEDLRAILRRRFLFTKVRLFADNEDIAESDDIKLGVLVITQCSYNSVGCLGGLARVS